MAPVEDTDLDFELLEIIGAGHRRISNDQSRERCSSVHGEKVTTIKKPMSRPGPLSKKHKLKALELGSENVKAPIGSITLVSSSETNITEERIQSKPAAIKIPSAAGPQINISSDSPDSTAKHVKHASRPRPGPLSKKPKLQDTKPTSVSAPRPPIPNVNNKDKRSSEKVISSDSDDIKTEIVEFERAIPLKSVLASEPTPLLRENDDNTIKPKFCTRPRPGPLSKKIGLAKSLLKNVPENCTDKSNKKVNMLQTSSNGVPKIKDKTKPKVQTKEKIIKLNNSTEIKSVQSKQSSSASEASPTQIVNEALILQETKWKEGIRKLQDEIGVPVSLEILMKTFATKELMAMQNSLNANKSTYLFELILPHIWMDLNLRDLLQCRVACKRWSQAIDNLLENHPFRGGKHLDIENEFSTNRPKNAFHRHPFADRYDKQSSQFQFISLDKVTSFLAKTRTHSRNPFVTKSVLVRLSMELNDEELSALLDGVTELLELHGKHIWYLHLDIQGYHSVEKTFKIIHQIVSNVQNLKSLKLMCHARDKSSTDEQTELIAQKSLPNLPNLESLDLCDVKLPVNLISIFIKKYCTSLVKLQVSLYRWKESYSHQIVNLKELSITAMCSQDNLNDLYCQLQSLKHLQNLTKISLVVMVTLDTKRLFGILQHFKGLRTVKIIILEHMGNKLHFHNDSRDSNDDQPKLSQVCSLELSLTSAQRSLNFLKYFPNLQHLHFTLEREFMDALTFSGGSTPVSAKMTNDKILRYLNKCILNKSATKSRLWSLLPSLQVFTVQSDCYDKSKNELCFVRDLF